MVKLNADIKDMNFETCYLLYGQEDYLRLQYKKRLMQAMLRPSDTMNLTYYEGKDIPVKQVIEMAETMPFLSQRRLIVIENSGFFKSAPDEFTDYFDSPCPTTCFIFVEQEVDKRSRMFKKIKEKGYAAQLDVQDLQVLRNWILMKVKNEGSKITGSALELLLQYTGQDMNLIESELEKLFCYTIEKKEITAAEVEAVTSRRIEDHIFDMIEAVAAQSRMRALRLYYDLLALKVAPMKVLTLINRQFNLMYQARLLREKGFDRASIAQHLSLKPFIAGKYLAQSESFSTDRLRKLVEKGCDTEEQIKTGHITDRLAVELMLIEFSTKQR